MRLYVDYRPSRIDNFKDVRGTSKSKSKESRDQSRYHETYEGSGQYHKGATGTWASPQSIEYESFTHDPRNEEKKEKISTVKGFDEHILSLCDVGEIEKEIEDSDEILSCVLDIQRCISQQISATPAVPQQNTSPIVVQQFAPDVSGINQSSPGISPGPATFQSSHHQTRSKLPKLVLPKFRGDATKFRTFWDSFESAVHKNPGLSKIDKFNYLNSLLESAVLLAIQGLTVTDANYDAAINILNQRFGKPQQIISAHMDELLKIPACNGDKSSQLRFVYDKVSVHVRGLEALGVDSMSIWKSTDSCHIG